MDTGLSGQVVLVTGASGGIGSAICRSFAAEGARLVLHYQTGRAKAQALRSELGQSETVVCRADLRKEADTRVLFQKAVERFGRVDTLVANAAAWETKPVSLHETSQRRWQRTIDGVLGTTFLALREFLRLVAKQRHGNAVLIASTAAVFGEAGHADYSAAKAAVAYGLTRSIKNEMTRLAPHSRRYCGGRINCICPGWTLVPRVAKAIVQPERIRRILATMALPQLAKPEDIANAAVFLSSDLLARHITGQILVIAGGMEGRLLWQPAEIDPNLA